MLPLNHSSVKSGFYRTSWISSLLTISSRSRYSSRTGNSRTQIVKRNSFMMILMNSSTRSKNGRKTISVRNCI